VTFSDDGGAIAESDAGWNLVANPYATPIDWDDLDRNGDMDATVYLYDPGSGYIEYTAGGGTSGTLFETEGYIAPFQAFFVKANGSSPSLSIPDITTAQVTAEDIEDDDATGSDPFRKSIEDKPVLVRLALAKDTLSSDVVFMFRDEGSRDKDRWDAYKLFSRESPALTMYSMLDNGDGLSVNTVPSQFDDEVTLPIQTYSWGCANGSIVDGEATMTWPDLQNLPAAWGLVLEDTRTGEEVDLRSDSEYRFDVESLTPEDGCSSSKMASRTIGSQSEGRPPLPEVLNHNSLVEDSQVETKSNDDTRFKLHIDPNAVPPVELSRLTAEAKDQSAVLSWATSRQRNVEGFSVQRKTEDGSFETIDESFVKGAGNGTTTEERSYEYEVSDLDVGTHTFRLKQVDTDGSVTYSDPVEVKIGLSGDYQLSTYPNPVQTQATVEFAVKEQSDVTVSLYNTLGQKVRTVYRGTPTAEETKRVQIDTQDLSSGAYFLRLQGDGVTGTERVTVVK
jgi:hypothetical protein